MQALRSDPLQDAYAWKRQHLLAQKPKPLTKPELVAPTKQEVEVAPVDNVLQFKACLQVAF